MRGILNLLSEHPSYKLSEGDIIDDEEMANILKATSEEEKQEYESTINRFLSNEVVRKSDLQIAVSYINTKLYLMTKGYMNIDE